MHRAGSWRMEEPEMPGWRALGALCEARHDVQGPRAAQEWGGGASALQADWLAVLLAGDHRCTQLLLLLPLPPNIAGPKLLPS